MLMKRSEVYELYVDLKKLNGDFTKWFQMSVYDVLNSMDSHVKSIEEIIKPPDKYIEFEQRRMAIVTQYAEKDDKGQVMMDGMRYKLADENRQIVFEEVEKLKNEYHDVITQVIEEDKEINQIMDQEIEVDIPKIKFEYVPETLNSDLFNKLIKIIDRGE